MVTVDFVLKKKNKESREVIYLQLNEVFRKDSFQCHRPSGGFL